MAVIPERDVEPIYRELRERKSYINLLWGIRGVVTGPISILLIVQSNVLQLDPEAERTGLLGGMILVGLPVATLAAGIIGLVRPAVIGYVDAKRLRAGGVAVSGFARMLARDLVSDPRGLLTFRA